MDLWHRRTIRHFRRLVGISEAQVPFTMDQCLAARALWGQEYCISLFPYKLFIIGIALQRHGATIPPRVQETLTVAHRSRLRPPRFKPPTFLMDSLIQTTSVDKVAVGQRALDLPTQTFLGR